MTTMTTTTRKRLIFVGFYHYYYYFCMSDFKQIQECFFAWGQLVCLCVCLLLLLLNCPTECEAHACFWEDSRTLTSDPGPQTKGSEKTKIQKERDTEGKKMQIRTFKLIIISDCESKKQRLFPSQRSKKNRKVMKGRSHHSADPPRDTSEIWFPRRLYSNFLLNKLLQKLRCYLYIYTYIYMNQCVGIILDAIYKAESCQVKCSTHSTIYGPALPHLLPWEVHVTTLGLVTPIFIGRCEEKKSNRPLEITTNVYRRQHDCLLRKPGREKSQVLKTQKFKKKKVLFKLACVDVYLSFNPFTNRNRMR